jgi:hypothetical protein
MDEAIAMDYGQMISGRHWPYERADQSMSCSVALAKAG